MTCRSTQFPWTAEAKRGDTVPILSGGRPKQSRSSTEPALPAWTQGLATDEPALARFRSPSNPPTPPQGVRLRRWPISAALAATGGVTSSTGFCNSCLTFRRTNGRGRRDACLSASATLARTSGRKWRRRRLECCPTSDLPLCSVRTLRAEVALAGAAKGLPNGLAISGRIDRLVVQTDRVLVIDFKTNRPAPDRIEDAAKAYIQQMAIYVAVLKEIFPGRVIEAALVWTDGPRLMPIPQPLIDATLAELPRP